MLQKKHLVLLGCLTAGISCMPLVAQANGMMTTVSMELTGVDGGVMDGVYTSPYDALIGPAGLTSASQFTSSNSVPTDVYCDDFLTDVHTGLIWSATVTNMDALSGILSPLTTLKFDTMGTASTQQQDYMAAAWLAEDIAGIDQSTTAGKTTAGELSFAMWDIFDNPGALSGLSSTEYSAAIGYLGAARSAVKGDDPSDFSNVNIYTPDPKDASQEYLTVSPVPEPGTLALFGAGIFGLGLAFRSRSKPKSRGMLKPVAA